MKTAYQTLCEYLDSKEDTISKELQFIDSLGIDFGSDTTIDSLFPQTNFEFITVPIDQINNERVYVISHQNIPQNTKYIWKTKFGNIIFSEDEPNPSTKSYLTYSVGKDVIIGPKETVKHVDSPKVRFQVDNKTMNMYVK